MNIFHTSIYINSNKFLNTCISGEAYKQGDVRVTLGGDQLTRVNLDSARALHAGTHTPLERFEHLSPVIEELFHVQQDLLEVTI